MNEQASRLIQLRELEERGKIASSSKIVSICSGKGGTGKTFFAANFAQTLAGLKKKILLVDLDLNFSNLNILLNQTSGDLLSEFFEQRKSLQEIIFKYESNLDLIFGDSGRNDYPRVSKEIINYFFISLNKVIDQYDFIILDSAGGADEITLHQLIKSDFNIIVTSPEPTAVMDAYVVVKLLAAVNSSSGKLVVVNKCLEQEDAESAFSNLSMATKHFLGDSPEFLGAITFDVAAHRSILNQQLLVNEYPESNSAKEIAEIAKQFLTIAQVANISRPSQII
jgi:flagellar biosynthesis protein FlhG